MMYLPDLPQLAKRSVLRGRCRSCGDCRGYGCGRRKHPSSPCLHLLTWKSASSHCAAPGRRQWRLMALRLAH